MSWAFRVPKTYKAVTKNKFVASHLGRFRCNAARYLPVGSCHVAVSVSIYDRTSSIVRKQGDGSQVASTMPLQEDFR
jgi:hypothetical protein